MKYSYIYSGLQAAFVFSGIAVLPTDTPTLVDEESHKKLSKNKFAKHLIDIGELEVQEIPDDEPKKTGGRGGKGGKSNDTAGEQQKAADEAALASVKAELTKLEVTFSDDETLEQLQAKLDQAKE